MKKKYLEQLIRECVCEIIKQKQLTQLSEHKKVTEIVKLIKTIVKEELNS